MKATDTLLVQDSFRKVLPIAEQASALFYARLFELDPSLRRLFRGDMTDQGRKLMTMLAVAVTALDRPETIVLTLRNLGARHADYGVQDDQYATVGAALLWTLEKGLGPEFTPEVRNAWTKTYAMISSTMIDAAREARAAA